MVVSIVALVFLGLVAGALILLLRRAYRVLRSRESTRREKIGATLVFAATFTAISWCAIFIPRTPEAHGIVAQLNVADPSGELVLQSIRMAAPDYAGGKGVLEKKYESTLVLTVKNDSKTEIPLGVECYYDAGYVGPYSPGAGIQAQVRTVPPMWQGDVSIPIRHLRFVKGGHLTLRVARCTETTQSTFLPPGSEVFWENKYSMAKEI